jgi:hypothetical protein
MLLEHTDLPLFSQQDTCRRRKLRQQIKNPNVELSDDEDEDETGVGMAPVQIMGLELLQTPANALLCSGNNNEDEDDYSYDSYANDSVGSFRHQALPTALTRELSVSAITSNVTTAPLNSSSQHSQQQQFIVPAHRPFKRRMSNCSSIGENVEEHPQATSYWNNNNYNNNEGYGTNNMDVSLSKDAYGYGDCSPVKRRQNVAERVDFGKFKSTRRGSLESCAEQDSVDYGRYKSTTARRSSMGSYAGDSVDYDQYKNTKTRRSSIGSYAGDSVDYGRYKSTKARRSSIGSYADDSVDYGRYKSTQTRRSSLGSNTGDSADYGKYKSTQTRRSSLGSYAGDSVDYGKYKSTKTARRGSLESYAGDSVDYGRYKSTQTRRSSLGSYAGDSVDYGKYKSTKSTRRGSLGSYADDSVDYSRYKSTAPRRSSVGSYAADSCDEGRYNSHKNADATTARRDSGFGIARRGSMESYADDSSVDYGRSRITARRGSLESVEYGRYKNPARRGSMGSVAEDSYEYGRSKNPTRRASIDSVDLLRNKVPTKAAEPAPAPGAGLLLKPPGAAPKDAGFLIKPPRRASLAGGAPHMLMKNEPSAARNPASGMQRPSMGEASSRTAAADKTDFRHYKSTMTRRASLGSGTAGYKGNINPLDSQSSQVKKISNLSRPQQQQQQRQRPQRRFSNMSDYATDSIADVIGSGGVRKMLGTAGSNSANFSTKRRFSMNSGCPSQESGEASVCSYSSRAA